MNDKKLYRMIQLLVAIVLMPFFLFAQEQERCLESGSKDRYAQKDTSGLEFTVSVVSSPPNFFVASGTNQDVYVKFGEASQGLKVFKDGLIKADPAIITSLNETYQIKILENKLYRNDTLVYEFTELVETISIGTYSVGACFTLSDWNEWKFVGAGWSDAPARLDTLYGDAVFLSWMPGSELDLAGHEVRWLRVGDVEQKTILPMPAAGKEITVKTGQYHFKVAAFDTAGNYSAFVDPVVYIVAKKDTVNFDCDGDGTLTIGDWVDCLINFVNHKFGYIKGNDGYDPEFDFNSDGFIDLTDMNIYEKKFFEKLNKGN